VRVHVVDPSAYTPPYDHALSSALAAAGADVELVTSRFPYSQVPAEDGYLRRELFYRLAARVPGARERRLVKLAEHVPDMLRYRRYSANADVIHFQWLPVQQLDAWLLPRPMRHGGARPLILTAHDILPREPRRGQIQAQRRLYDRFDAVIVHSRHGRERLLAELDVSPERVRVIPHGALTHLAGVSAAQAPLQSESPVVLMPGLMRPYKGLDVLLEAWRGIEGAELWVAGMPRMDIGGLQAQAPANVRFLPRFLSEQELVALLRRADLVVLPYREIDQSGVLFAALALGSPLLLSDAGGFPEVAATGAARTFPTGDVEALRQTVRELLASPEERRSLQEAAARAVAGPYSWSAIAAETLSLYTELLAGAVSRPRSR
jgi:glycosyltransferase involved in cell wall biosynthesis